jgi:2-polyprenyl-3-methyl-5-hydroxy-6-metoxy-1,4-benzoquinol methylase
VSEATDPQPIRSKKVQPREARDFDKTSMRAVNNSYRVNRDYAAHFFRWGWTARYLSRHPGVELLDVGCGPDQALARTLVPSHFRPRSYTGVDYNKVEPFTSRGWVRVLGEFDFTARWQELGTFDLVTCFEVIEHMPVTAGAKLLEGLRGCVKPGGRVFLSTPVFNGAAARNHLHEYTVPELRTAIERAGLQVVKRYGTFASYHDVKKVATPEEVALLNRLNDYYDGDVTACFLAPLYPDASRNNLWVLEHD